MASEWSAIGSGCIHLPVSRQRVLFVGSVLQDAIRAATPIRLRVRHSCGSPQSPWRDIPMATRHDLHCDLAPTKYWNAGSGIPDVGPAQYCHARLNSETPFAATGCLPHLWVTGTVSANWYSAYTTQAIDQHEAPVSHSTLPARKNAHREFSVFLRFPVDIVEVEALRTSALALYVDKTRTAGQTATLVPSPVCGVPVGCRWCLSWKLSAQARGLAFGLPIRLGTRPAGSCNVPES